MQFQCKNPLRFSADIVCIFPSSDAEAADVDAGAAAVSLALDTI